MKLKTRSFLLLTCAIGFISGCANTSQPIPHLEKRDGMTKLIVDGRPFICVAGELANSSSSDVQTMESTWPRLAKMNLNTILSVISWDLIEPDEGKYDFWMIDYQIKAARANNLRLIFLWMASWKNGMSHYPPRWVKANQDRFPRAMDEQGHAVEVLSTFGQASRDADAKAFAAVMKHIREVDSRDHTVIAMQVENEVGLIASSRDHCPAANEAFAKPVPRELTQYLLQHKDNMLPEFKKIWVAAGSKTTGTWKEVFGKNVSSPVPPKPDNSRPARPADADLYSHTDEIFMAWNYARYMGYVAEQGKKQYPLPMFVNAWLVNQADRGPGDYPSGGPVPLVHDIWRAGAPAIDILASDIYTPQYAQVMQEFGRNGNPVFIPETRQEADSCWAAFTQYNALCFSHMGIDNSSNWFPDSPFARIVRLAGQTSGAIAEAQGKKDATRLITLTPGQNPGKVEMGDYLFDFTPVSGAGAGRGAAASRPATGPASRSFLDSPFVLIINTAPDEYYFATNGNFPFRVSPRASGVNTAAAATIDRGYFSNGKWVLAHRLNGDDILTSTDLPGAAANHQSGSVIPLGSRGRWNAPFAPVGGMSPTPTIWRVTFYQYH